MPLPLYNDKQKNNQPPPPPPVNPLSGLGQVKIIVAIAAGKGGVGKSSVTVNLALALQALGYKVGIMDTDIYGPSIRKMLPEDQMPIQKEMFIEPALCRGIKMISMAYFRKDNEASAVRAPIANGLITNFIQNILWGPLDFLLIDFPPGTGDVQLTLAQKARLFGAIVVTTPQEIALLDVRKAISLFDQVKIPLIGVVENMSYYLSEPTAHPVYIFGKGGGEKLAHESGTAFLGQIPLDPMICASGDNGKSLMDMDPENKHPVTAAFGSLAKQLIEQVSKIQIENEKGAGSFELHWTDIKHPRQETLPKILQTQEPVKFFKSLFISRISQKDNFTFSIVWNNGQAQDFPLSVVQKNCPCAGCKEMKNGPVPSSKEETQAVRIKSVGRYGIQIQFTNGCSAGIFSLEHLYQIGTNT